MNTNKEIVANKLCAMFGQKFEIAKSLDDSHWARIAGLPHVCLTKKDDKYSVFYVEITELGNIASNCLQLKNLQDKNLPFFPVNYMIVPKIDLKHSKEVAAVMGVKTRFGTYILNGEVAEIEFE